MSNEDPYRPNQGRDRGAYTPPTDDDLPFNRGGYDPRRGGGGGGAKAPPMTLIISGAVLLLLIIAVVVYYRAGPRSSNDAPPAVGAPVVQMKTDAPLDAQPIDPEAGIDVYDAAEAPTAAPTFTPPPEAVQPRPAPRPAGTTAPVAPRPTPVVPPPAKTEPRPPATVGGTSGVQIGAFSTPSLADREFAAIVGRYPQFTAGADKRVQEVTASNGSTVYRTTVTGLSRDQATGLCNAIKAAGGDCFVR
ncbi:MAG: SPOR domain-containing protein [Alphaproteobacteria bacterium]|uniref:SPOR domain-containing protein n=1 Tax=Brevundimonas sp. TaxID=1871086 RepID=UPI00185C67A8|nr:SPOR domain-containing protein [Brevundimonas sp.]MBA3049915.1 SPOR domain-containing protein [Brevundimonas sp.]MBU3972760.1 SPOR domain-containing protein [Alphaproteobacteria bacterium]MBU4136837.1 SPOR domain-containing protein [Alphaproteobacteria bacterium]